MIQYKAEQDAAELSREFARAASEEKEEIFQKDIMDYFKKYSREGYIISSSSADFSDDASTKYSGCLHGNTGTTLWTFCLSG